MNKETRQSRIPKRNEKGQCPVKIGGRDDCRVFKFSRTVSDAEVEQRSDRLKEVYDVCGGWTELANVIADSVRAGVVPVPLPDKELCGLLGVKYDGLVHWRSVLVNRLPRIPWAALGESTASQGVLGAIRQLAMGQLNQAAETVASIDRTPPQQVVAPIKGSLHEALRAYAAQALKEDAGNHDRHGKIRQMLERHPDQPLATLGIDGVRSLFFYWRQRPLRNDAPVMADGSAPVGDQYYYSEKRSREQLSELIRFLKWLHLSQQFAWRHPDDFHLLDRSIRPAEKSKSILQSQMPIFKMDDLAILVRHAGLCEKLWIVWCLNCSHGAAEVGRVQWEDIYLDQDHPWKSQGLDVWPGGNWVGFLRPKTDVVGWWLLWPETVELLLEWKEHCRSIFDRPVVATDPLIVRESGAPLYGGNKNGQAGFANQFARLKKRCERMGCPVANLPAGTLRNQFSDWCGGGEADATVASVALSHGIPHKGDKLLYKHYSNRPWKRLFEKQMEFQEVCRPVLNAIKETPALPPKMRELAEIWDSLQGTKMERVKAAAAALGCSVMTIYRHLDNLTESNNQLANGRPKPSQIDDHATTIIPPPI